MWEEGAALVGCGEGSEKAEVKKLCLVAQTSTTPRE
jgi:hypothetical protein